MQILHFIIRNKWSFIIQDEYYLLPTELIAETITKLYKKYSITDDSNVAISIAEISKTTEVKRIQFSTLTV